jgi:hypothetical protein
MTTAQARVAAGISLLAEQGFPEWHHSVTPGILDIGSANDCVLAQLFGDYETGLDHTGIGALDAADYGFDCLALPHADDCADDVADLNTAWLNAIAEREQP